MKSTPDDTIYRTKSAPHIRVRIVKSREIPPHPSDPQWLKEIKAKHSDALTVAEVKNGKRWHGYKPEDLIFESEWLKQKNKE